jgi:hypothetical protein
VFLEITLLKDSLFSLRYKAVTSKKFLLLMKRSFFFTISKFKMVQRPENIASIINGVERYNPEHIDALESYLNQQCENNQYDCEVNLAILKL